MLNALDRYEDRAMLVVRPYVLDSGHVTVRWFVEVDGASLPDVDVRFEAHPDYPDQKVMTLVSGNDELAALSVPRAPVVRLDPVRRVARVRGHALIESSAASGSERVGVLDRALRFDRVITAVQGAKANAPEPSEDSSHGGNCTQATRHE
jgi:hypothetical protein